MRSFLSADFFGFSRGAAPSQSSRDRKLPPRTSTDERRLLGYPRYVGAHAVDQIFEPQAHMVTVYSKEKGTPIEPSATRSRTKVRHIYLTCEHF